MDTYTITQIEEMTGVLRRNIHFYVKERLLSPPLGLRSSARYNEEHLLRLGVIRVLQGSHLRLEGIREALEKMDLPSMRRMLSSAEGSRKEWDAQAVDNLVGITHAKPRNVSFLRMGTHDGEHANNLLSTLPGKTASSGDTWRRIVVAEGIELNMNADLPESTKALVQEYAEKLRTVLEGKE
jgi:DNA-binding transcriptional MerR regulator